MRKTILLMIVIVFLLTACSSIEGGGTDQVISTPTEEQVPVPLPTPEPVSGGGYPQAVLSAQAHLAEELGIAASQVEVATIEPVDWPDSCLGIETEEICAQVITPGYRILLRVGIASYEIHTDSDGQNILQAGLPTPDTSGEEVRPALTWQGPNCEVFSPTLETAFYGHCGEQLVVAPSMTLEQLQALSEWSQTYAGFTADTPAGTVTLNGFGQLTATQAEQRMMAEWARLQFDIAQSGRAGAAWGLALAWKRVGGIAGFCDDVLVYLDGRVIVSDCKTEGTSMPTFRLNATRLAQLYAWVDAYTGSEYHHTDPATADAITMDLYLYGQGAGQPDEIEFQVMNQFAADLVGQAEFNLQAGDEVFAAEDALRAFFTDLHDDAFEDAARIYGGDRSMLVNWNPGLEGDLPAMLGNACSRNGLRCMLPRSVTFHGPDVRGGYQFLVEFTNSDGTLFQQGPCCGGDSREAVSLFVISVIEQEGVWQVMDLPPYVP